MDTSEKTTNDQEEILQENMDTTTSSIANEDEFEADLKDLSDLPKAVIVTNVPTAVFTPGTIEREQFEGLFADLGSQQYIFEYFRSFKRVRVTFCSPQAATTARLHIDQHNFAGFRLNCFFAQTFEQQETDSSHLQLPPLEKQFLISPPCSPPVGWDQGPEAQPVLNFDLMARLAALTSEDRETEIIEATESGPAIIIHPCYEENDYEQMLTIKPKIQHTRRPDVSVSRS